MSSSTDQNPNIFEQIRRWADSLPWANWLMPAWLIFPVISICLGFKRDGKWFLGWIALGTNKTDSLFYNGIFFTRLIFSPLWSAAALAIWYWLGLSAWYLPLCIGFISLQLRWAGSDPSAHEYLQTYIGVKLNGEIAIVPRFRIQSDNSAASGTTGGNSGQAVGFNEGTK